MKEGMQVVVSCPPNEDLSAFHDEALRDVQIEEHVVECDDCRGALKTFAVIDEAVQAMGMAPGDLVTKISGHCASLSPKPLLFRVLAFSFWRNAAAAAAVILAAVAIHYTVSSSTPASSQVVTTPPTTPGGPALFPSVGAVKPLPKPPQLMARIPERPREGRTLSPVQLTRTNASSGGPQGAVPFVGGARKLLVPPRVRHVWVVDDVAGASAFLRGSLPEAVSCTTTAAEEGKASLQVLLTDEQLQSLVDRLAEAGWPLLSPGVPQPRRGTDLILSRNVVRYDVDLLVIPGRE